MFTLKIHTVDQTQHQQPSSSSSNTKSKKKLFNPSEIKGVVHLFRNLPLTSSSSSTSSVNPVMTLWNVATRTTNVFIVAVPNYLSYDDFLVFCGRHVDEFQDLSFIRNDAVEDRYSVLIKLKNQAAADGFCICYHGKRFSPSETEVCHIYFAQAVEYTDSAEVASIPQTGYTELPTCPVCLERLDYDTSAIQITHCDHSFQCPCITKWAYLSCQVCQLCQQQDGKPTTCAVCGTSDNPWVCLICGFVGCGRYEKGHAIQHYRHADHCYSLELETQQIWDYVGDKYVHRLNQSKVGSKSTVTHHQCVSSEGECGDKEDEEFGGALFSSKVDTIMDEYNFLLATQMETQRQTYEILLAEAKSRKEISIAEAIVKAEAERTQELQNKLEELAKDTKTVSNINEELAKDQESLKKTYKEIQEREIASLKLKDEKIMDLEEQEFLNMSGQQSMQGDNGDEASSATSNKDRSLVWRCFDKIEGETPADRRASCRNCGNVYSANPNSGTSNLGRHMRSCFDFEEDGRPTKRAPLDQDLYREKMAIAIIKHNYPFSYVEHEATRQLHKFLHRDANPITRNTAKEDVLAIYRREKSNLKIMLEKVSSRICFTSDLWSSITSDGYMALTAHYVDEDWVLRKKVLNFRFVPPPHTGKILASVLIRFLSDWGIDKKVFTVTLDNAKYNDGLVETVKSHLRLNNVLVCDGKFLHVRCGAHVLNLIVQAGLKVIEGSIEKVRDSVKYVRGSSARKRCFSECIQQLQLQCGRLVCQDVVTRWNSTYMMLDCAIAYQNAYARLDLIDENYASFPSEDEWIRIKEITKFLKPFYDITTLFSGNSYPTSNLYFLKVYKIQSNIELAIHNSDPIISKMGKEMKTKFDKYWDEYCKVLSFAIIMDPRYKVKIIEYCFSKLEMAAEVRDEKVLDIIECLCELYKEYEFSFETHNDPLGANNANVNDGDTVDELDELGGFESFRSRFRRVETSNKSELTLYLEEPEISRKTKIDVLQFWKENQARYPRLAFMARDLLSVPITTVASESSFSIGGRILSKYRSSLSPSNAEALLCTRDWLDLKDDEEEMEGLSEDLEDYNDN